MLNRYLGRASYLVAFTLIVVPLFDSTMSVMPPRFGDAHWRFGTVGLLSNALMIPMAGVLIAFATATALEHRRALKVGGALSWLASLVCLAGFAAFVLDALQSQSQIRPDMHLSFIVATSTAGVKILIGALSFALFGNAGFKGLKVAATRPKRTSVVMAEERTSKTAAVPTI
jgi:hypothetical protein